MSKLTLIITLANAFFAGINLASLVTNILISRSTKRMMAHVNRTIAKEQ
jgi:hypothetical protein